jgi:hypothetical protein
MDWIYHKLSWTVVKKILQPKHSGTTFMDVDCPRWMDYLMGGLLGNTPSFHLPLHDLASSRASFLFPRGHTRSLSTCHRTCFLPQNLEFHAHGFNKGNHVVPCTSRCCEQVGAVLIRWSIKSPHELRSEVFGQMGHDQYLELLYI